MTGGLGILCYKNDATGLPIKTIDERDLTAACDLIGKELP
jgi:hypothetical protein